MFSIFFSVITHFYEILQYNFEDISPNLSYRTKAYKANKMFMDKEWARACGWTCGELAVQSSRVTIADLSRESSVEDSSKQITRQMWRRAAKSDGFQA